VEGLLYFWRTVDRMGSAIGFIGAGNLAEALIRGLRDAGVDGQQIVATNRSRRERLAYLRGACGIATTPDKGEVSAAADVLLLAMKPADLDEAMRDLQPHVTDRHLVISLLAGVRCASVERYLAERITAVVRAMPNLSAAVLASTTALAYGRHASADRRMTARALFDRVGGTVEVNEDAMDAVTAVAGSGPAYVYLFMEGLIEAGIQAGLPAEAARDLAIQTVFGAAKLVRDTAADPADLRRLVTSPGGTTNAALTVLEARGFKLAITDAVRQAIRRAKELGR
jgi:pyrroline-5-carboxylate reductase